MSAQNEQAIAFGQGISIQLPNQQLHNCFEALVDRQPDEPAIIFKNKTLTYCQLDQSSNALANALLKRSIRTEEPIGVLVDRSGSLPIAFLAILKAGGVYVPLVHDHPANRLANIVEQTGMRYLIALDDLEPASEILNALAANNDGIAEIFRTEDTREGIFARPDLTVSSSSLAAILFTSGTNGQPKGVLLRHDACINMVCGHLVAQNIASKDRLLLSSGPGFILGFRELCLPLLSGAAYVAVTRNEIDNPDRLLMIMSQHKVSIALFTPSYLRLLQGKLPSGLRCIMTAGEHPDENNARHYAKSIDYWNMHGATEVCGTICMYKVNPNDVGTLPSGRPFSNTSVYLLDEHGDEVPQGEIGEIHVVGIGLAGGYLNQPELSAQFFVETKFGRAYKTRDMGRWRADGNLETIGRSDDVIKISGQSVALSEIERTLLRHPKVKQAAVIQNGTKLVAFLECGDDSAVDWRDYLSSTLPAYMIPSSINQLERLPTNSSGKIDRQALLTRAKSFSSTISAPPEGRIEQEIAEVWADILKLDAIGRHDNFFAIGGTSLLAIAISQQLQSMGYAVTVPALLVNLTVAGLADHLSQVSAEAPAPADNISTRGQEDFWIGTQLGVLQSSMLITRLLRISGDSPSQETWRAAWQKLLERHSALRTAFYQDTDEKIRWQTYALDKLPAGSALKTASCNSLEDASELVASWTSIPFNLNKAPLARAGLIQTSEAQLFWFALHHAVVDGLSARILQEELYALLQGKTLPPAADGINLACAAEQAYLRTQQAEIDRHFWQEHLKNTVVGTNGNAFNAFATDFERPLIPTSKAAKSLTERLDAPCVEALTRLARSQGVGMHSLLLAILGDEARRRSGRTTLIIGSAISMRPAGAEQAVGLFVNLLPLVLHGDRSDQFNAQLHNAQSTLNTAIQSIGTPSSQILRDFQNRNPDVLPLSRTSIFDVSLTANTSRISKAKDAAFSLAPQALPGELNPVPSGIDLAFSHEPDLQGGLILTLAWNPELYRQSTAQSWLTAFKERAVWLGADLSRAQNPMPPLLPFEQQLLQKWEQGPALPVPERCFQQVFEAWAQKTPLHHAVVCEHETVTYAELDRRANGIAHALLEHGLESGDTVAVLTDICDGLPAVVLGIWKAGAAYLPLAADHPPERLAHMMADAKARILVVPDNQPVPAALSDMATAVLTPDCRQSTERRPDIVRPADSVAYVIYTSGTTGMPKGVPISHAAMINTIQESARAIRLTADDRVALVATPSFDASLWELGLGLLNGAALAPISKSLRDDPWAMKDYYAKMAVTVAFHAPSYLRISKNKPFNGLRVLIVGGEPSSHEDVNIHGRGVEFWHAYGPTETTIIVSLEHIPPFPDPSRPLSVGPPLANTLISIRNGGGQPVPPGVIGEIWLGGLGLSRGYLNNDELTAERFVTVDGCRFYRSGDLGCWTDDGRLVIKGRMDHQIKIHGQRIELEEIETALLALPDVTEAIVLVENAANGTQFLRGFVAMAQGCVLPGEADWHARLAARLPHYMIPATLTAIERIPVTVNGKVDREALLQLVGEAQVEVIKTPPSGPMEVLIAPIWSELLGQDVCREANFFGLGGNSLLAVAMAHRLSKALAVSIPARYLYTAPTLAAFAARAEETRIQYQNLTKSPEASDIATEGELEFWVAEQAGINTTPFIMPLIRKVQGKIPGLAKWNRAWAKLTERHESLRTQFVEDDQGTLRRVVTQIAQPGLEEITVSDLASAKSLIRERQSRPIPLNVAPLWQGGLVHVEKTNETLFWLAMHHAVGDGVSFNILLDELVLLLQDKELPPLVGSYAHSAARALSYLAGDEFKHDFSYWRNSLAALPETAFEDWSLDMPRLQPGKPGYHRLQICLPADITLGLKAIAQRYDSSMHALMLTLLALETRRRSQRRQFLIGTPADMRETTEEAGIIGYYVNMLPLIMDGDAGDSFETQLTGTQQVLAAALHHGRVPFARIYNDFRQQRPGYRHPSRYPLFDFAVNENPQARIDKADIGFRSLARFSEAIEYELVDVSPGQDMVFIHEILRGGELMLQLQVNSAVYLLETATAWFNSLRWWVEWLCADKGHARMPLPKLLPQESELLAQNGYGRTVPRPNQRFHELFESVIDSMGADSSKRLAVMTPESRFSYLSVEDQANRLANALIQSGIKPGAVIGVLTGRSPQLPSTILGIWKAGAIYLPLSIDLPVERLCHMVNDAAVRQLIVLDGLDIPQAIAQVTPTHLRPEQLADFHSHRPSISGDAGDTAYIIYTSGSTGLPKGALIAHKSYVNMALGCGEILGINSDDRCLMFYSPSFDVSLSDIGVPLLFGATVCPVHDDLIDSPNQFMNFLNATQITVADISPTYLRLFDSADFQYLRILVTGGEAPFPADIVKYSKQISYFNAYGPTENTVTCALGQLTINHTRTPSCGLPLPNTSIHICDANGNLLPPGEIGELWLGGMGLANGYLGRADLTSASFVETPEGRRYRSGDIGRWLTRLPNSPGAVDEVQFMGRMDSQIKMNGIRIELGEIEHIVNGHPSVFQATVLADEIADKKQRLSAFIHLRNDRACPSDIEWRDYLSAHLPAATIPTSFIIVDSIPVNSSGKVDVASLRGLARAQQNPAVSENPPQTPMEKRVAAIWCELLKLETVRKDDNFFALGGHSLVAISAAHRLERDLNRPVAARELFAFPVLSDFSRRIDTEDQAPAADFTPTDKATTGQLEFWVAEKIGKANRGLNLTFSVAEQDRKVAAEQWRQAWAELVGRHPALRTYFKEDADGQLLRQILPALDMELERQCLPDLSAARIHIANLQAMIIPMSSAPLWRAGLVFVEDTRQEVFWLALHHAVGDGISIGILLDELSQLLAGEKLPALQGDYNHFAGRELAYLKDRAGADAEYWSETLDGLGNGDENTPQPFDEWPLDFSRPINNGDGKNKGGHFFRIALDAAAAKNLKAFASRHGASLHALMMALLAMETSRRTGRPNFVMGTVGSTRESAEDSAVVNYFLNMLPIACRINRNDSVEQSMAAMQLGISRALQHERYPFAQICQDFRNRHAASNHPTRFPLFDLAVTENPGLGSVSERHIKLVPVNDSATGEMRYDLRPNPPPQDMVLIHEPLADDRLGLYWYVDANLYEKDTALAWVNALLEWMRFIVSPERQAQTALPLLTAGEEKLLDSWQYGPSLPKPTGYLQDQFMRVAGQEPHSPALLLDQETQSYDQIDKQSNGLAQALRRHGISPGVAVGVLTERSTALPATVLAIWKAGGCYLPLSAELPGERLKFMAEDADINLLVALDGLAIPSELASYPFLRPATLAVESTAPINHGCRDTDPAYIIYTSGSTGEPKGVVITFEGYTNFCLGMKLALTLSPDDRILQISSPSFDAWLHELGLAWFHGSALAPVVRRELDDISGMLLKMQGLGITIATLSPSYLGLFGNAEFPDLRMLMTMGEPPVKANALYYAGRLTYINGYGPSENSVGSCIGQITPQSTRMTAGRPLANTSAHILNKDRQPVPPGSAGILWLGGRGLSPGYLNRPELTAERFVETPEGRFYNSGDLARWTQQGEIEILGRIDNQVKLRGQRIELEEIEHQIGLHPDVLQAAVVIHGMADGTPGLYGFVCLHPEASAIGNGEWRSFLAKKVPDYMIPSAIKAVPGIPVSLAGKVDRKKLIADYLDQDIDMIASNDSDVGRLTPPGNRVEKLIAEAWSEIFPGRTIYSEDNFFELGGHSLAAISVVNRLRLEFTCTINNLYEHPVLADFAKTCQPRHEHIRDLLVKVKLDWQAYSDHLEANPNQRIDGLKAAQEQYCARNKKYSDIDLGPRKDYENILLTGATGYVGCYLLREMLKEGKRKITALVRGTDHAASRDRLHQVLEHYFGPKTGEELAYHPRLQVLSSDLSQPSLGLSQDQWAWLATRTQAIFHCAANVKHYGHYQEFHRDNINSVQNLLELAAYNLDAPMDFHLVSTTSVVGKPPESGFKLFTEYDLPNPDLSDNYYIRTKQEAERLVLDARGKLSNASIYRVGNVVFATDDSNLQINLKDNAFFRLVAALIELGAVPKKVEALFCHVDLVARAVMLLAETQALSNETHHIEHSQETSLAEFISTAFPLVTCDFGMFIDHLLKALDKPEQQRAFYEVLDGFNLYGGQAPQVKAQHIELTSGRTNELLKRLGLAWTDTSSDGQLRFLREAALHFKN